MRMIRRLVLFVLALAVLDTVGIIEVRWGVLARAAAETREVFVQWRAEVTHQLHRWAAQALRAG
jgi:hypothetical protein